MTRILSPVRADKRGLATSSIDASAWQSTRTTSGFASPTFAKIMSPRPHNAIGSAWTVEMTYLRGCGTAFEVATCLRRIEKLLHDIDVQDRTKFCKSDLENSVKLLKGKDGLWTASLTSLFHKVMGNCFGKCIINNLPNSVLLEIFFWIPTYEMGELPAVCKDWNKASSSDLIWSRLFVQRFVAQNPNRKPKGSFDFKKQYKERLRDPEVGDQIEVSWRGKFRLEAMDVYQGLAWWAGEIVDKDTLNRKYKVHYPGWEARWDEWVDLNRLRWAADKDMTSVINVNDVVELWCTGSNVPGAWLEARVKKIKQGRYHLGKVLSTTRETWVERERLRPVTRAMELARSAAIRRPDTSSSTSVTVRSQRLLTSTASCSLM